jgi:hypothetical protein
MKFKKLMSEKKLHAKIKDPYSLKKINISKNINVILKKIKK